MLLCAGLDAAFSGSLNNDDDDASVGGNFDDSRIDSPFDDDARISDVNFEDPQTENTETVGVDNVVATETCQVPEPTSAANAVQVGEVVVKQEVDLDDPRDHAPVTSQTNPASSSSNVIRPSPRRSVNLTDVLSSSRTCPVSKQGSRRVSQRKQKTFRQDDAVENLEEVNGSVVSNGRVAERDRVSSKCFVKLIDVFSAPRCCPAVPTLDQGSTSSVVQNAQIDSPSETWTFSVPTRDETSALENEQKGLPPFKTSPQPVPTLDQDQSDQTNSPLETGDDEKKNDECDVTANDSDDEFDPDYRPAPDSDEDWQEPKALTSAGEVSPRKKKSDPARKSVPRNRQRRAMLPQPLYEDDVPGKPVELLTDANGKVTKVSVEGHAFRVLEKLTASRAKREDGDGDLHVTCTVRKSKYQEASCPVGGKVCTTPYRL
jgi:hypothetical protein